MKIEQFDKDILRIRSGASGILLIIVNVIFIVLGGVAMFAAGGTTTLRCVRDDAEMSTCELRRSLLGIPVHTTHFKNLQNAYIVEETDDEGIITYRVELVTGDHHLIPFTEHASTGYEKKEHVVGKIKTFVDANQPTLEVVQKDNLLLITGLAIILVNLLVTLVSVEINNTTWTFDRINGMLTHRRGLLFGTKTTEYPLYDITDARVETSQDMDGDTMHRVVLLTKHWQTIPLTLFYTSFGLKKKDRLAKQINAFLDMRWQNQTEPQ